MKKGQRGLPQKAAPAAQLGEYRRAQAALRAAEGLLAEYCTAIEEFGLDQPGADERPVQCTAGLLAPAQVRAAARAQAAAVERLQSAAQQARGRVLVRIVCASGDAAEYRALRRRYVDGEPCAAARPLRRPADARAGAGKG
jgi:hypothetical protein